MFIGLSLLPDYFASKLNLFVALAPVVRFTNSTSLMRVLSFDLEKITKVLLEDLGMYNVLQPNWESQLLAEKFCSLKPEVCERMLRLFSDLDPS
jgi:hypothetical protein